MWCTCLKEYFLTWWSIWFISYYLMIKHCIVVLMVVFPSLIATIAQPWIPFPQWDLSPKMYHVLELKGQEPLYDEIPYKLWTIVSSWKQRWNWEAWFVLWSCTDYAASRRPDLFTDWKKRLIVGDAKDWFRNAKKLWMKIGKIPRKWAIAVFAPWKWATGYGHAAYVEAVNSTGLVMITEMNYSSLYTVTVRVIPSSLAMWYIY